MQDRIGQESLSNILENESNLNSLSVNQGFTITTVTPDHLATKRHVWTAGGWQTTPYNAGYKFRFKEVAIGQLCRLEEVLRWLSGQPQRFVVRGGPIVPPQVWARRILEPDREKGDVPVLERASSRVVCVDYDDKVSAFDVVNPVGAVERVLEQIGLEGVGVVWQVSASAGILPGIRLHLWMMADLPLSDEDLRAWAKALSGKGIPVDPALYSANHPHFTATPIIVGAPDPVPVRMGSLPGGLVQAKDIKRVKQFEDTAAVLATMTSSARSYARSKPDGDQTRQEAGALRWLEDKCDQLRRTGYGIRHEDIAKVAFSAGGGVGAGKLDHHVAETMLREAVSGWRHPKKHHKTIKQAMKAGRSGGRWS